MRGRSGAERNAIFTAELNFVFTTPGARQLTRILSEASSSAKTFVRPKRAVLLTE